jgi:hypothetical protein
MAALLICAVVCGIASFVAEGFPPLAVQSIPGENRKP